MTSDSIVARLRRFLLLLTALTLIATLIELVLEDHNKEPLQFLPFILCAVGLLAVGATLFKPTRATLMTLRGTMLLLGIGSLIGLSVHLIENFKFEQEVRPNSTGFDLLIATLKGANPLLAPGVLGFAALLALAATYYHPLLKRERSG